MVSHSSLAFVPRNIIIRMPNWLGDAVMATPVLTDLRHHWPEAKISAMCQGGVGEIIQSDPHIDELLNFKRPSGWFHRQTHGDIISPLRQGQYDLGLLLTNSFSSAWWFWRGHVSHRVGFATHWRSWLLNHPVPLPPQLHSQHLVTTYKALLEPLGIPLSSTAPQLFLSSEERQEAKKRLSEYRIPPSAVVVGINPGAAYGSAKCWPPEQFQQLALRLLALPDVRIIFFGDKAGSSLVQQICLDLPEQVINLAGKTSLRQLMALIACCQLFITSDSGPMHLASALGVPLIALFGSTSEIATGPYNGGKVIHKHVPCSPCYRRECPLIDFRCMTQISVLEVYEEAKRQLFPSNPRSSLIK